MIVYFDSISDTGERFFHNSIVRRLNSFFLQAAMEPFDVTVIRRVMVGRPRMRGAQPVQRLNEPRRSELYPIVCGHRHEKAFCTI
jgi:hypothetical protein